MFTYVSYVYICKNIYINLLTFFIYISYILPFFDLIKLIKLQAKKLINIIYQFIFLK